MRDPSEWEGLEVKGWWDGDILLETGVEVGGTAWEWSWGRWEVG